MGVVRDDGHVLAEPRADGFDAPDRACHPPRSCFIVYLLAIAFADLVTAALNARAGLALQGTLLAALLVHGALVEDHARRALLWSLATAPLIRLVSLALPLGGIPVIYWYAAVSLPVLAAVGTTSRALGYTPRELGLALGRTSALGALACVAVGAALGFVEYAILAPAPLAEGPSLAGALLPAAILTISTGFEEELVFRGLLQRAATGALGPVRGVAYATAVFASLHIGYLSIPDFAFVFVVGLLLAALASRTRSLLAPTLLHAAINVTLFLAAPFLLTAVAVRV